MTRAYVRILPLLVIIVGIIGFATPQPAAAAPVEIYYFWGDGCPHCAAVTAFFESTIIPQYPDLKINKYEVFNNRTNQKLFQRMAAAYGSRSGAVPALFIGDQSIVGNYPDRIQSLIADCAALPDGAGCINPNDKMLAYEATNPGTSSSTGSTNLTTWIIVIVLIVGGVGGIAYFIGRARHA